MSLDLDKRHRAMLREMGVRVWLPVSAPADAPAAEAVVEVALASQETRPAPAPTAPDVREAPPPVRTPPPRPPVAAAPPAEAREAAAPASSGAWSMGAAQALYAEAAHDQGARWLVLAETPAAALQREPFNPFEGEAGKLLDNMLRAARLHKAGVVLLAPLVRGAAAGVGAALPEALPALLASAQPDVVLVMGRLAAQALLQSSEPFGKLRGQVHGLHGAHTVVTYDATYLLRNPSDKAKAWDDLCLAMSRVTSPAG
ncbi:uracil-DNA glycosylase family protein [Polaromonas sp. LjRoot131]|uniref:uracil-DNA glycosylase family protein n=1 Tax=Polaromonas sp. LjRoot131 TaxID=3342262 RepID=UPI003ECF3858